MIARTHINVNHRPEIPGRPPSSAGVTLVELLVAMSLLVLLGTMLVLTFSDSLSMWNAGERQRQQYEEAHFILQKLSKDLRQTWMPIGKNERSSGHSDTLRPYFISGFIRPENSDRTGRWLELVHSKEGYLTGVENVDPGDRLERHVYVHLPGQGLYFASFSPETSLPHHSDLGKLNDPKYVRENLTLIGPDVWYVGFRFWGPWIRLENASFGLTGRWPAENQWGRGNGVSLWWDSSRKVFQKFRMYGPEKDLPAVPGMVRIRIEMGETNRSAWPRLSSRLSERAGSGEVLPLSSGSSRHPASGFFLIDQEWVRAGQEKGRLTIWKRGARGTETATHEAGTEVRAGKGFQLTVKIPIYPGQQYYIDREVKSSNTR